MLLALPDLLAVSICTNLISGGCPGWLHLVAVLFVWNAMKFLIMGPTCLVLLTRAHFLEPAARNRPSGRAHRCTTPMDAPA
ncbi:hypothetical protein [Acidipropionibacterium acidipropionici]|uniref:hypothetical protein n=1 Tax=Acidipropionibacterium acidipropionici TaxID=1748 RepID=UPI0018E07FAF|nr:hypothetical protein [Acidipropionibacterium acidipropionici]